MILDLLIAVANFRWCFEQVPVLFLDKIFMYEPTNFRNV